MKKTNIGANCVRPQNKNKAPLTRGMSAKLTGSSLGITLIALIITIIIMLILAVVSIKVASESGLFKRAEAAADQTETESIKEIINDKIINNYDYLTGLNMHSLAEELNQFNSKLEGEGDLQYISLKIKNENYMINKDGTLKKVTTKEGDFIEYNGLIYQVSSIENTTVKVSKISSNNTVKDIIIPETIPSETYTYTVTEIEGGPHPMGGAFSRSDITSVQIPNTVEEIGSLAFYYCSNLTNITIPEGVTTIGYSAFESCRQLNVINIPQSLVYLGAGCFADTPWMRTLNYINGFIIIGNGILLLCDELYFNESGSNIIEIPNNVKAIASNAFFLEEFTKEMEVIIPESVRYVDYFAFFQMFPCITPTVKVFWSEGQRPLGWSEYWNGNTSLNMIYSYY